MTASPEAWREGRKAWERLRSWFGAGAGSVDAGADGLNALSDVGRLRMLLDQAELAAVRTSRRRGSSWAEIAARLGVTRQSAWERWRDLDEPLPDQARAGAAPPEAGSQDWPIVQETLAAATAEIVNQSRRRSNVTVPDVVGLSFEEAREVLTGKRLVPLASDPDDVRLADQKALSAVVTDQSPESGAKVPAGSRVTLWLGRGGSAGVREPRRPSPAPRSQRAMRDERTGETLA